MRTPLSSQHCLCPPYCPRASSNIPALCHLASDAQDPAPDGLLCPAWKTPSSTMLCHMCHTTQSCDYAPSPWCSPGPRPHLTPAFRSFALPSISAFPPQGSLSIHTVSLSHPPASSLLLSALCLCYSTSSLETSLPSQDRQPKVTCRVSPLPSHVGTCQLISVSLPKPPTQFPLPLKDGPARPPPPLPS